MPQYNDLTNEQKETLRQGELFVRGFLRELTRRDIDLKLQWFTDNVGPILALLDAGAVIPNTSGLAGAQSLTKEQLTALKNWINSISSDIETNKSVLVKAIGVNAD